MKIVKIEQPSSDEIFIVYFAPNWIEKLFGVKPKQRKYKRNPDRNFSFGGGGIYYDQKGNKLSNGSYIGEKIDKFTRQF